MSTLGLVITFLGGGAVGGVATAMYQASRDSAERSRARMLDAAEASLATMDEAFQGSDRGRSAIATYRQRGHAMTEAVREFENVFGDRQVDATLQRLDLAINELLTAVDLATEPGSTDGDRQALQAAQAALATETRTFAAEKELGLDKRTALLRLADAARAFAPAALHAVTERQANVVLARRVAAQLARVRLVFAGTEDFVSPAAIRVVAAVLGELNRDTEVEASVNLGTESDPTDAADAPETAVDVAHPAGPVSYLDAQDDFVIAVANRVKRRHP